MRSTDFRTVRDERTRSWKRARPRQALIERVAWDRWLVTLRGGETHEVSLRRDHGAYEGWCDCDGFAFHDGPCAHLCTVRKAAFGQVDDLRGDVVRVFDVEEAETERTDSAVEQLLADGGRRVGR